MLLSLSIITLIFEIFLAENISNNYQNNFKKSYNYTQLSTEKGLSHPSITCIFEDSLSTLWVGTKNGLNRIVGNSIINHYPFESSNTGNNQINKITYYNGNLLLLMDNGLFTLSDSQTIVPFNSKDTINGIIDCIKINKDLLLINRDGLLFKLGNGSKELKEINSNSKNKIIFISSSINKDEIILYTKDSILGFYNYKSSLNQLNKKSQIKLQIIPKAVYFDNWSNLWIGSENDGIYCLKKETDNYQIKKIYNTTNSNIPSNRITAFQEKDGKLWVGSSDCSIFTLSISKQTAYFASLNGKDIIFSIPAISSLIKDSNDKIWVGTPFDGLYSIGLEYIKSFIVNSSHPTYGSSASIITSLYCSNDDNIWIGTSNGDVNCFIDDKEIFKHYKITNSSIDAILPYKKNYLLLLSNGVLSLFNSQEGSIVNHKLNKQKIKSCFLLNKNNILILSDSLRIFSLASKASHTFTGVIPNTICTTAIIGETVYFYDENIIYKLNIDKYSVEEVYTHSSKILSIDVDDNGTIWFSDGGNLYARTDDSIKRVIKFYNDDKITVIKIVQDVLFMPSTSNLYCYSISLNKFINLNNLEGFTNSTYFNDLKTITSKGDLYFGGYKGILRIKNDIPLNFYNNSKRISVIEAYLNNKNISKSITQNKIYLDYDYSDLKILISKTPSSINNKEKYRFKIDGVPDFSQIESSCLFTLPHLQSGNYILSASYISNNGNWSTPQTLLQIKVKPPWWSSTPMVALYSLLLCILAFTFIYYFISLRRRKKQEEIEIRSKIDREEKLSFLIGISHELRTPLTLILSPLKEIKRKLRTNDLNVEEISSTLTKVFSHINNISSLINMILDAKKVLYGINQINLKEVNVSSWLTAQKLKFEDELSLKRLSCAIESEDYLSVQMDEMIISIIFSNLMMNAIKYSENGDTITISAKNENDEFVRICIADQGEGICNNSNNNSIFNLYYQGTNTPSGYGIGLHFAQLLVKHHRGRIGVFNNKDKGSTFYFDIPLNYYAYSEQEVLSATANKINFNTISSTTPDEIIDIPDDTFEKYSLLVVDDDKDIIEMMHHFYDPLFKHVYYANDGEKALTIIHEYFPDIVISDIMMPKLNGFELCKTIKNTIDISHIPIILFTAYDYEDTPIKGYKLGADNYLPKPFDTIQLSLMMNNILKEREQSKKRYSTFNEFLDPSKNTYSYADEKFIIKLNKFIMKNIDNPNIDVELITQSMAMSRPTLYNKMKAISGMGLMNYVNKLRIDKSKEYLSKTDLLINEIAINVGFTDGRYFSKVFKQYSGMTPNEYKHENSNKT